MRPNHLKTPSLFNGYPIITYSEFGDPDNTGDYFVTEELGFAKLVQCLADGILGNSELEATFE